jgi:methyl-accepting chemotaxis protein
VADEIRSLSKRSGASANDIRNLIAESIVTAGKGSASIHDSGETLKSLSSSVNEVTDFVTQIMTASQEQSQGVDQVHAAMIKMDNVMQANMDQAQKLTSVASMLSSHASHLQTMLNRFKLSAQSEG